MQKHLTIKRMNFLELAQSRYTTKAYRSQSVSEDKIQSLKEILRLTPSSINSQPWQFVFIDDKATKEQFARISYINEQRINEAIHLVVFLAHNNDSAFEAHLHKTSEMGYGFYEKIQKPRGAAFVQEWIDRQVYIALGFFLSACAAMGIDSTPMEGILIEEYDRLLKVDGYKTLFAVAIGYRSDDDRNQPSQRPKTRLPLTDVVKEFKL